jgi:hypothetical protein
MRSYIPLRRSFFSTKDLTSTPSLSVRFIDPSIRTTGGTISILGGGLKASVYRSLYLINSAYDQIIESLQALRQHRAFRREELDRYMALSKETRSVTNSFVAEVIATVETNQAGRRYRERRVREKADEEGQ